MMFRSKNTMDKHPKKILCALHFSRHSRENVYSHLESFYHYWRESFDSLVPRVQNLYLYQNQIWGSCNPYFGLEICRDQEPFEDS